MIQSAYHTPETRLMTDAHAYQSEFLANISHEFRTPLAGMKVSIELLLENRHDLSAAELAQLLTSLHLSVSNLQLLIDNLLESGKLDTDHFTLRRQPITFDDVLSETIRVMQPILTRRQQRLTLDAPIAVPTLFADRLRLQQVMVNLIDNASKYSPMAAPIGVTITGDGDTLSVAVLDRGLGVPADEQDAIFARFVRLEGDSRPEHGAGLGLSVVKAIIERHGGRIGVMARAGGGSVFTFTLPLRL